MDAAPGGASAPHLPPDAHRDGTFANNFWGAGDRGYDTVIRRVKDTSKTLDDLRAYYKARAEIEAEYAKRMAKLARTPIGQDETGAIATALATLQQETERMAQTHQGVADELKNNLSGEIHKFQQSQASFHGPAVDAIAKLAYSRRTQQTMLDRARDKYQAECVKVNTFTAQMTLVQGRDLERISAKLEKAKRDVEATERDYRQYTKVVQNATHNWNREWKGFLDQAQDHDEERIEFIKQNCWRYINAVAEACVEDDNACQDLFDAFKASDAARDSANFVVERGTGNMIFDPPEFVNFAEGHAPAPRPPYRVAHFSRISKRPPPPIPAENPEQGPGAGALPPAQAELPPATPLKDASAGPADTPRAPGLEAGPVSSPQQRTSAVAPDADALYSSPVMVPRNGPDDPHAPGNTSSPAPAPTSPARGHQLAQPSNPFASPAPSVPAAAPAAALAPAGPGPTSPATVQSDHVPVEDRLAAALRGLQVAKGETPAADRTTQAAQAPGYQAPNPNPFAEDPAQTQTQTQTAPLFQPPPQGEHPTYASPPPSQLPYQSPTPAQPLSQPAPQAGPQPTYQSPQPPAQQAAPMLSQPSAASQYMRDYQRQSGMLNNGPAPWTDSAAAAAAAPASAPVSAAAHPAPGATFSSPPPGQAPSWQAPAAVAPAPQPQLQPEPQPAPAPVPAPEPQPDPAPVSLTGKLTDEGLPVQFYVKAMFDYTATTDQEFSFTEGDIIAVTEYPPDGWWKGELMDEARRRPGANLFPSNFCSLLV